MNSLPYDKWNPSEAYYVLESNSNRLLFVNLPKGDRKLDLVDFSFYVKGKGITRYNFEILK